MQAGKRTFVRRYRYIYTDRHIYVYKYKFVGLILMPWHRKTKELINYRGPGGDRTHDLQTEANPPAASCPAPSLHATEIVSKTQLQ